MKLLLIISTIVSVSMVPAIAQRKSARTPVLTLPVAQRVLSKNINELSADNAIFTCRACYSFDDKEENDNFVIVTYYGNMIDYLRGRGYVRRGADGQDVFTAKAKRSKYFDFTVAEDGRFGGAGFRFADFRNPRITVTRITDPKHIPIEYELVPTDVAMQFFGGVKRIQNTAAFSYEGRKWTVCIGCRN